MQAPLFESSVSLPTGLVYRPDFLTPEEEAELLSTMEHLPLFHPTTGGYPAKRRMLHFGWSYDYEHERIAPGPPLPPFLVPHARKIAKWLAIPKDHVVEALINEYPPGYGLGWHRDNERFEHVIGISLGNTARLRFRPITSKRNSAERRTKKEIIELSVAARSAYVMQHAIRWEYQHSVAPVEGLRHSITFRTLMAEHVPLLTTLKRRT